MPRENLLPFCQEMVFCQYAAVVEMFVDVVGKKLFEFGICLEGAINLGDGIPRQIFRPVGLSSLGIFEGVYVIRRSSSTIEFQRCLPRPRRNI